jgi:hypothetical protein
MPLISPTRFYQPHAGLFVGGGGGGGSTTLTVTASAAINGAFTTITPFSMSVGSYNATTNDLFLFFGSDTAGVTNSITVGGVSVTTGQINADAKTGVFLYSKGKWCFCLGR